jgi:L-ascorbate metabolism protein UlaG (beta-lactamase superfamily)
LTPLATQTPHAPSISASFIREIMMMQRRTVLRGLTAAATLLPLAGLPATARAADMPVNPDDIETDTGDLVIQPVNHATVVLTYDSDVIYVDPIGGAKRYLPFNRPTAILVTHAHPDHFDVPTLEALAPSAKVIIAPQVVLDALPADLKAKARLMKNGDKGDVNGLPLSAIPAYNTTPGRTQYHPKGVGNGYILTLGQAKVYVAGDTEDTPEMRALTGIGVAFLPMNLPYTMSGDQAASAVKEFKPLMVYPYHYGKDGQEPAKFAAAMQGTTGIQIRQRDWYAYS